MYKKFGAILLLLHFFLLFLFVAQLEGKTGTSFTSLLERASSGQRVILCGILEKEEKTCLSKEDYQALLKIVEAEAGNEDEKGKILVANVVLNRVRSEQFPNTVKAVVLQKENGVSQFSPVGNGRYEKVRVSEDTIGAVEKALHGEDLSEGALYFAARKYASPQRMKWFDEHLTRLFSYGGHEFFV